MIEIRVSKKSYDVILAWSGLSWVGEAVTPPQEILLPWLFPRT